MHQLIAATLDTTIREIRAIQDQARNKKSADLRVWLMIVMRTPKGWRKFGDGKPVEGTWRARALAVQPLATIRTKPVSCTPAAPLCCSAELFIRANIEKVGSARGEADLVATSMGRQVPLET
jgi:hypothetical protein